MRIHQLAGLDGTEIALDPNKYYNELKRICYIAGIFSAKFVINLGIVAPHTGRVDFRVRSDKRKRTK